MKNRDADLDGLHPDFLRMRVNCKSLFVHTGTARTNHLAVGEDISGVGAGTEVFAYRHIDGDVLLLSVVLDGA